MGRSDANRYSNHFKEVIKLSSYLFGGTPLKEEDFKKLVREIMKPKARYSVSAGQAYSRFFEGLKQGKIYGTYCEECGMVYVPPKIYCPFCFKQLDKWIDVKDEGKVISAVVSYYSATLEKLEKPEIIGVIKLDVPGKHFTSYRFPGILHRLCNVSPEEVINQSIFDARVKARWKPPEERIGDINDIECFEVLRG